MCVEVGDEVVCDVDLYVRDGDDEAGGVSGNVEDDRIALLLSVFIESVADRLIQWRCDGGKAAFKTDLCILFLEFVIAKQPIIFIAFGLKRTGVDGCTFLLGVSHGRHFFVEGLYSRAERLKFCLHRGELGVYRFERVDIFRDAGLFIAEDERVNNGDTSAGWGLGQCRRGKRECKKDREGREVKFVHWILLLDEV